MAKSIEFYNICQASAFVARCEADFERQLDEVCAALLKKKDLRIIALSGPTCSGKTTTGNKIVSELTAAGANVHIISIDDFFHEQDISKRDEQMASGKNFDYDSIDAIDFELLKEKSASILRGDPTELPGYDFTTGRRFVRETVDPDEHSVFVFEGIQAIYPEVRALLGERCVSVYISVAEDLEFNEIFFGRRELRLIRRLVRDYKFRGADPTFTFYLWRSVVSNEEKNIYIHEDSVDYRINSLMPYEVMLLKKDLLAILAEVDENSMYYAKALDFARRMEAVPVLDPALVPAESVMREFIGK